MAKVTSTINGCGSVTILVDGDTKQDVLDYFTHYCLSYHPAGYGTKLRRLYPYTSIVAGVETHGWTGEIYRYSCCD